jgi:hypothetical protein
LIEPVAPSIGEWHGDYDTVRGLRSGDDMVRVVV